MSSAYATSRIELEGRWFLVRLYSDENSYPPWENEDGHGPVREISSDRHKHPSEQIMTDPQGRALFAYDMKRAVHLARTDGWGISEEHERAYKDARGIKPGAALTKGQLAAEAARLDYVRLNAWLCDDWWYCGVAVNIIGPNDEEQGSRFDNAVWGIESDSDEYIEEVAMDLAGEILDARKQAWRAALKEARERHYWAQRDVETV